MANKQLRADQHQYWGWPLCIIHYTATHRYADCSAIHTLSCNVIGSFDTSSITDGLYKIILQFLIDLNSIHPCLLTCGGQYQSVKH